MAVGSSGSMEWMSKLLLCRDRQVSRLVNEWRFGQRSVCVGDTCTEIASRLRCLYIIFAFVAKHVACRLSSSCRRHDSIRYLTTLAEAHKDSQWNLGQIDCCGFSTAKI